MAIELKIPDVGESVQEVQIARWLKQEGDAVEEDENVVELETDKASMELPAPSAGVLAEILKKDGAMVSIGETIAHIEKNGEAEKSQDTDSDSEETASEEDKPLRSQTEKKEQAEDDEQPVEQSEEEQEQHQPQDGDPETQNDPQQQKSIPVTPAARRALREHGLTADQVPAAGDRLRPEDIERYLRTQDEGEDSETDKDAVAEDRERQKTHDASRDTTDLEEVVPMSLIRRRIAERLVAAQQSAALLTTFNEIEMSRVIELRKEFGDRFKDKYGIKLGFMSFFVKAAIDAFKQFPEVNAEIRGTDIHYHNYFHIGIAIGSKKGLVVPVLRHAERMSFAEIEKAIDDFASRAQKNKLKPDELQGGTFTISNGGIYGSLLSTPIVNPPQSGVLGMHAIEERPVARDGQVVIRPMMYVALTYDHRIVDGSEAVSFLRRIKEDIEQPPRMLLEA